MPRCGTNASHLHMLSVAMLFYEILCFSLVLTRASAIPQRLVTSADTAAAVVVPADPNVAGLIPVSTQASRSPTQPSITTKQGPVDTSGAYSRPASGCVYTDFPEETITQVDISFEDGTKAVSSNSTTVVSATGGCICHDGAIAGPWTDTHTESGIQFVYCETGSEAPTYVVTFNAPREHQLMHAVPSRRRTELAVSTITVRPLGLLWNNVSARVTDHDVVEPDLLRVERCRSVGLDEHVFLDCQQSHGARALCY